MSQPSNSCPPSWVAPGMIFQGTHFLLSGPENGDLICLVHGIGSDHRSFGDVLPDTLSVLGFRVLRYDLLGRGFSAPHSTGRYGATEHIDQLHRLLEHVQSQRKSETKRVRLIGHSMGGSLVVLYTASYPEEVSALTLIAPAGLMSLPFVSLLRNVACIHGIVKRELKKGSENAWRNDFYRHDNGDEPPLEPEDSSIPEAIQPDQSAVGEKTGIAAREQEIVNHLLAMHEHNPGSFDAFFECIKQFPLCGIQNEAKSIVDYHRRKFQVDQSIPADSFPPSQPKGIDILVIWGEKDTVVPTQQNLQRYTKIFGGKSKGKSNGNITAAANAPRNDEFCRFEVALIPNTGHDPPLECPRRCTQIVKEFLLKSAGLFPSIPDVVALQETMSEGIAPIVGGKRDQV